MLERLALVIHWIGFIIGAVSFLAFTLTFMTAGSFWYLLSGVMFGIGPHLCGWLIRFILTGNKSFFPWKS